VVRFQGGGEWRYTLNSALHRRLAGGQGQAAGTEEPPLPAAEGERPTVYTLYEENLGALTPLIAEELRAAEEAYPAAWLEDAVREAVRMNRRNWRYVQRILERWRDEGRDDATVGRDTGGPRDLAGRYRGLIRR
jgi:DnaD/phage-associated family protein